MDSGHSEHHPGAVRCSPAELIEEARRWIGVPYRHQGRSARGLDCIGFVIWVCAQRGILPEDFERRDYGRLPRAELLEKAQHYCTPADSPGPATLVLIRWPGDRLAGHSAICTGENLIHCYSVAGKVVEHGFRAPWPRLAVSHWHLPGVHYG